MQDDNELPVHSFMKDQTVTAIKDAQNYFGRDELNRAFIGILHRYSKISTLKSCLKSDNPGAEDRHTKLTQYPILLVVSVYFDC